jgi:hypothetical protein
MHSKKYSSAISSLIDTMWGSSSPQSRLYTYRALG